VKNGKCGFVDLNGNIIIPYVYDDARDFENGLARVTKGKRSGLIDKAGNCTFDNSTDKQKALEAIEQNYFNTDSIRTENDINSKMEPVKKLSDTNLFLREVCRIYATQYLYVTVARSLEYIQDHIDEAKEEIIQFGKKYNYVQSDETPYYRDNALREKKRFFDACDDYGRKLNGDIVPKWK